MDKTPESRYFTIAAVIVAIWELVATVAIYGQFEAPRTVCRLRRHLRSGGSAMLMPSRNPALRKRGSYVSGRQVRLLSLVLSRHYLRC
jgi:hypothetical protein